MTDIRWSHSARRDYRNLIEWLADRNLAAADRIADAIERSVANLADMPQIGRIGRVLGTRELVVPRTPYVVIIKSTIPTIESCCCACCTAHRNGHRLGHRPATVPLGARVG